MKVLNLCHLLLLLLNLTPFLAQLLQPPPSTFNPEMPINDNVASVNFNPVVVVHNVLQLLEVDQLTCSHIGSGLILLQEVVSVEAKRLRS